MHLDDGRIERLLHGDSGAPGDSEDREHLNGCIECQERIAAAKNERDQLFLLLRHLDHPAPRVHPNALAARALAVPPRSGRWAAGILLLLGFAGAAYALPGSPVRVWLKSAREWIAGKNNVHVSVPSQADPAAGIAARPGREFLLVFQSPEQESKVLVSLTDGPDLIVRAQNGRAGFNSAPDRLVVQNRGPGTFEVAIPRTAPRVEIQVAGKRIFLKLGGQVTATSPPGPEGTYVIPLWALER